MKDSLVVKSNGLIEARYELSLNEQKIILYAVSKLDRKKENFNVLSLNIREFTQLLGTTQERYTEIREIVRELRNKEIIINTDERELITGWLSSIDYLKDQGTIELEFSQKLIPYLLQLKQRFTRYQLKNILNLTSKYSIRIYELTKQYENIGKREFKLENLKKLLFIEDQYDRMFDLERFVLKTAKKEINLHTDIRIDYEKIKTGRKITSILFTIESKDLYRKEYIEYLDQHYGIKEMKKMMGLKSEYFNSEQIIKIFERASENTSDKEIDVFEYVRLNYIYASKKLNTRNIFSYLLKCIENDYASAIAQISIRHYLD